MGKWKSSPDGLAITFVDRDRLPARAIASVTKTIRPDGTVELMLTMHPKVHALQ